MAVGSNWAPTARWRSAIPGLDPMQQFDRTLCEIGGMPTHLLLPAFDLPVPDYLTANDWR